MKHNILLIMAMAFTLATYAQQHQKRGGDRQKGQSEWRGQRGEGPGRLMNELNLSEGQKEQMKALNQSFMQKMKTLNENENITVKQQRDERFNLMKQHRAEMKNLLTPEQKEKAENLRAEQQKKMQAAKAKGFEKMAEQLKLSEDQKNQFAKMQEKHRSTMQAIMQNEKLDRGQRDNQLKALKAEHNNEISRILTKEQKNQLDQWKQQRPKFRHGRPGHGPRGGNGQGEGPRQFI
ncbi:MAG: hypothetical protein MUE71_05550 [Chitinophagaceae bacterium]|jgi:Spy/CpxP family protein refolding chaperone|nr:hypothetical protein [Chitinophagaceae bacterium]MCU0403332.1 hypothetical protein [Chitinophagaceae bacterium]